MLRRQAQAGLWLHFSKPNFNLLPLSVLHTWKTTPGDGERKDFLLVPLDDFQARRVTLSTPSRGAALMSHFGCRVLLHLHAMDDILWEISDTESTKGVTKHISVQA